MHMASIHSLRARRRKRKARSADKQLGVTERMEASFAPSEACVRMLTSPLGSRRPQTYERASKDGFRSRSISDTVPRIGALELHDGRTVRMRVERVVLNG